MLRSSTNQNKKATKIIRKLKTLKNNLVKNIVLDSELFQNAELLKVYAQFYYEESNITHDPKDILSAYYIYQDKNKIIPLKDNSNRYYKIVDSYLIDKKKVLKCSKKDK